jgi:hypothetical protein
MEKDDDAEGETDMTKLIVAVQKLWNTSKNIR